MVQENEFNITFEGNINQVEINVLTSTLLNFSSIIQEINKELDTNKKIEITIRPFEKGSFDIFFALLADSSLLNNITNLFSGNNIEIVKSLIFTLKELLNLKKLLKGEKPQSVTKISGDQIKIENNKGEVTIIKNKTGNIYFNNCIINNNISNAFDQLANSPYIDGLTLKDSKKNNLFEVQSSEFPSLANENKALSEDPTIDKRIETVNGASLNIFKIVFGASYKWDFFYYGNKIPAKIIDADFFNKIKNREISFSHGDTMIVDLQITKVFNNIANVYENKSYEITKVIKIIQSPSQSKMNL